MVMTITAGESGCIHYVKRPGAVLDPGCVIAKLQLDDPSRVQQVRSCRKHRCLWDFNRGVMLRVVRDGPVSQFPICALYWSCHFTVYLSHMRTGTEISLSLSLIQAKLIYYSCSLLTSVILWGCVSQPSAFPTLGILASSTLAPIEGSRLFPVAGAPQEGQ